MTVSGRYRKAQTQQSLSREPARLRAREAQTDTLATPPNNIGDSRPEKLPRSPIPGVLEPAFLIPIHKLPLESPKSVRAAHAILGSKPGASRKSIYQRYRRLARKSHPDHGGDRSRFEAIKAAYDLLIKSIKPPVCSGRGRPRKHFYSTDSAESGKALRLLKRVMKRVADCDATHQLLQDVVQSIKKQQGRPRYRIVNTNAKRKVKRGGKTVTETVPESVEGWNGPNNEGFETEEQAKASYHDLKVLIVKLLQKAIDNPTDSTAIALLRDLTHHTPRYEIVGPPGQQRTKKHRDAKKAREEEEARKRQEYIFKPITDRHGSRGEISGGWDWKQIENVTAAHGAAAGGCGETVPPARRSRGNGFRCCFVTPGIPYVGNGPDPFDKFDGSADTADTYFESRLSPQDPDDGTGTPHVFKSYDQLLCESVEDRELPFVFGLDLPPQKAFSKVSKETGEEIDEDGELEAEQLGIYDGNDEFSEFPEWDGDDFSDILEQCYAPEVVPDPYQLECEQNHQVYLKLLKKEISNPETRQLEERPADAAPVPEPAEAATEPAADSVKPAVEKNPTETLELGNNIPAPIPAKLLN